jgi:hypothetical protein
MAVALAAEAITIEERTAGGAAYSGSEAQLDYIVEWLGRHVERMRAKHPERFTAGAAAVASGQVNAGGQI